MLILLISYVYYFNYNSLSSIIFNDNMNFNINKKELLLKIGLNYKNNDNSNKIKEVSNEIKKPIIYIYNTHNTEQYVDGNIVDATFYLKDTYEDKFEVIYDNVDVNSLLLTRGMNYSESYLITKELLKQNLNDNIDIYIDLHRDSGLHNNNVVTIDNNIYAKIMFVIGKLHDNYQKNYYLAEELNNILITYNEDISRGILLRDGARYNQELSSNIILIEMGCNENTMEEVKNSIDLLKKVLVDFYY